MTKKKRKESLKCVQALPAACPKCACTDRTAKASTIRREITGKTRDGNEYTQVQWSYANCKECGERYRFIEYLKPGYRTPDKT